MSSSPQGAPESASRRAISRRRSRRPEGFEYPQSSLWRRLVDARISTNSPIGKKRSSGARREKSAMTSPSAGGAASARWTREIAEENRISGLLPRSESPPSAAAPSPTVTPLPIRVVSRPAASRRWIAFRRTPRLTPARAASSRVGGSRSPALRTPLSIKVRSRSSTTSTSDRSSAGDEILKGSRADWFIIEPI